MNRLKFWLFAIVLIQGVIINAQYFVKWQGNGGGSFTDATNTFTKTNTTGWTTGAISRNKLLANSDGSINYPVTGVAAIDRRMFGLSTFNTTTHYNSILYTIYHNTDDFYVYESGVLKFTSLNSVQVNDTLTVERTGSNVYYSRTRAGVKTVLYTSLATIDPDQELYGDCSLYTYTSTVAKAYTDFPYYVVSSTIDHVDIENGHYFGEVSLSSISNGFPPYTALWPSGNIGLSDSLVNIGVNEVVITDSLGNDFNYTLDIGHYAKWDTVIGLTYNASLNKLSKTLPQASCNSGAVSVEVLRPNKNGSVKMITRDITSYGSWIGFTTQDTISCYTGAKYALYQTENDIYVYESGVLKFTLLNNTGIGEEYSVERVGSKRLIDLTSRVLIIPSIRIFFKMET